MPFKRGSYPAWHLKGTTNSCEGGGRTSCRTLGVASKVSHRAATHGHSPEEPGVPTETQERKRYLLLLTDPTR